MARDTSRLEIDHEAIVHNVRALRGLTRPGVAFCAVVKADGYGLGVSSVLPALIEGGADWFGVYALEQARPLLAVPHPGPVLVMMPVWSLADFEPEERRALADGRLHLTIHDPDQLDALLRAVTVAGIGPVRVHVHVDTGMHRGGAPPESAAGMITRIATEPAVHLAGVSTHFASAESDPKATALQHAAFERLLEQQRALIPADCRRHIANTGATFRSTALHLDMIRVGQGWAGYGGETVDGAAIGLLRPCLRWTSRLIQVKRVAAGEGVGYGLTWRAARPSVIGLVPVGYADGYPARLGNRAHVGLPGHGDAPAPVVGRVSMDQLTLDLTDIAARHPVRVGDAVELITPDRARPNHLPWLARLAETSPYELLCRLTSRLPRTVTGRAEPVVEVVPETRVPSAQPAVRPA